MEDSSEKVSFRVDMQCSSLRADAFLVFDKGSQPTLGQQITDMRPTVGLLLAEDFRKSGKRQSADSWPTFGQQLADCRPTVGQQSAHSFLGELFFIFSKMCAILQLVSAPLNPTPIAEHFRRNHPQCEHSYGQHIYMSKENNAK